MFKGFSTINHSFQDTILGNPQPICGASRNPLFREFPQVETKRPGVQRLHQGTVIRQGCDHRRGAAAPLEVVTTPGLALNTNSPTMRYHIVSIYIYVFNL